jgi:hypothetical protein
MSLRGQRYGRIHDSVRLAHTTLATREADNSCNSRLCLIISYYIHVKAPSMTNPDFYTGTDVLIHSTFNQVQLTSGGPTVFS